MDELTTEDRADVRIQLSTALLGAITPAVKGLAVRVTRSDLTLVAYFERVPLQYERQLLSDAVAEAAYSLGKLKLEPEIRCVVTKKQLLGLSEIEDFESRYFGAAASRFWVLVRHGETPDDEEDTANSEPLSESGYTTM